MATSQMSEVIQHLRRTALLREGAGLTDGQLLEDYVSRRDAATLAALVWRHGPMVWGVCRRVLRSHHDVEDAFQATFLVFVRKAASIASRELLANWLYGVAHRTALKARGTAARRKGRERQVTAMLEPAAKEQDPWHELQPLLDEELSRLSDKYRAVIVLCDLEGKTRKEAARLLGVPEGTVGGWLARARGLLAKRLGRRGVAMSGAALGAVLAQNVASASMPVDVVSATIEAVATGSISVQVAALTEGVLKTMLMTKLKIAFAVLLVVALIGVGAGVGSLTQKALAARQPEKSVADAPKTPTGKEADNPRTDNDRLQGTWEFVAVTQGGKTIKLEDFGERGARWKTMKFIGDKVLTMMVNTGGKEVEFKNGFKLNPSRKPKAIDLTADGEDKGKTAAGLYELEGDLLRLCFPGQPGQERPTRLESQEGESYLLLTYKRADKDQLQGTWQLVMAEMEGARLAEGRPEIKDTRLVFDKSSVTMLGKTFHSPNVKKPPEDTKSMGTFALDTRKSPKVIMFTLETNPWNDTKDFTMKAIYVVAGDTLKLCLGTPVDDKQPLPMEFSAGFGSNQVVNTFKRVTASAQGGEKQPPASPAAEVKGKPQPKPAALAKEEQDKLQGPWRMLTSEADGVWIGEGRPEVKDNRLVIEKASFTFSYTRSEPGEEIEKTMTAGEFALDTEPTPLVMALTWKNCPWNGKADFAHKAIYELKGDTLRLCLSLADDPKQSVTEFSAKSGSKRAIWTFKREPASAKEGEKKP